MFRLITKSELQKRPYGELRTLYAAATNALTVSAAAEAARRNALASLENIGCEMALRLRRGTGGPGL